MVNDAAWRTVALLCLLLMPVFSAPAALAQNAGDAGGASDYPGVPRFPGAVITQFDLVQDSSYRLALGRMQRVNGRVTAGREERIQGTLTRITYQIPGGFSGAEVFVHYLQFIEPGNSELFRCQGRACGSSSFWANDILGNRVLYGPEQEQFYAAFAADNAAGEYTRYYVLYAITRGNRSVYAHLDIIDVAAADPLETPETPEAFIERLQEDGSVIIRGISFDETDRLIEAGGLDLASRALQLATQLQVFVVAHLRGADDVEALLARSQQRADVIVQQLQQSGVNAARLRAEGVGPLSPVCAQAPCSDRVELVLRE